MVFLSIKPLLLNKQAHKNIMDIEFRAVKKDDESFEIQYRYELNEWLKLEYFNEKVVNIIVDALNNHAKNTKIS